MYKYQLTIDLYSSESSDVFNELFKKIGENIQVFNNVWFVKSELSSTQISDRISSSLTRKDYFSVIPLSYEIGFALNMNPKVLEWIRN